MRLSPSAQKLLRLIRADIQGLSNSISTGTSAVTDAIRQHEQGEKERYQSQQEQQDPSSVGRLGNAVESIAQSQKNAHSPKRWYKDRKFWEFLVSLATVIAVVLYTVVTYRMWNTMSRTLRD